MQDKMKSAVYSKDVPHVCHWHELNYGRLDSVEGYRCVVEDT